MKALSVVHGFICTICVIAPALAADGTSPAAASSPVSAPPAAAICHRVSEGNKARAYCGSARQWADLRARVGFRCRNEGRKDELCASASEWKRLNLSEATKQGLDINTRDMINAVSERTRQMENTTPMTGNPSVNAPMQGAN